MTSEPAAAAPALIGGQAAALDAAVVAAARLLTGKTCVVVAGLATDIAGAEAAIALARQMRGVIDHAHASAALRDLGVMRGAGWLVTTPLQARARADLLLFVGHGLDAAAADLRTIVPPALFPDRPRRLFHLHPGHDAAVPGATAIAGGADRTLGVLRALVAGRKVAPGTKHLDALADCAAALRAAQYGVAVWSAAQLDPLAIEMLCGLVDDLNATTRFAGLPVPAPGNAAGVTEASAWLTGFPMRTGFAREQPEHDPWRFDATRLVDSGEADAVVWISATETVAPAWKRAVPIVALVAPGTVFAHPPAVCITVGAPGVDHDGVLFDPHLGTLTARAAAAPGAAPSVARVLDHLAAELRTC